MLAALAVMFLGLCALGCNLFLLIQWCKSSDRWHNKKLWCRIWRWGWGALAQGLVLVAYSAHDPNLRDGALEIVGVLLSYASLVLWLAGGYVYYVTKFPVKG